MTSLPSRGVYTCVLAITMIAGPSMAAAAADATIKVAFWNVMSGKGVDALAGHPQPFRNVVNCTDPTQPLNAWGVGATQAELAKVLTDPTAIALGLAESWDNVCGSPENIRQALGWTAHSSTRNGVGLVARHGFAGPEQWLQLDTSLNTSPADTAWVLRAPVCLNTACSQSMPVYVTHWYGTGVNGAATYARQAQQTVAFLAATSNGQPHVIIGDFNVWEGSAAVCNQNPTNGALPYLRYAGYLDAWLTVQGSSEGYTGMANRAGCGIPQGYAWKRIDYAWTLPSFQPVDMQRFAVTPAGDASPSDHYGVIVTLPSPGAGAPDPEPDPDPPPPPPPTVWTSLVKATATGATLQKTSGCSSCFDAGAIGTTPIVTGGAVSFSVSAGYRLLAGLGSDTSASTSYAIDYAFSFWPNGKWEIREKNIYKKEGPFAATDRFTIAVEGTVVKYYRNGALVYSSLTAATAPLVMDTSLSTLGATVTYLPTAVPPPPTIPLPTATDVKWTALVRTIAAGTRLEKASGCGSCFDAGAVSEQQIVTTGSVSFTVAAGHRQVIGLGRDASPTTSYSIDYAFSFQTSGTWEIRESNIYRKEGSYAATDVFKVSVESSVVKYYKNDVVVYISQVPVSGPLVVDAGMASVGATVSNVILR